MYIKKLHHLSSYEVLALYRDSIMQSACPAVMVGVTNYSIELFMYYFEGEGAETISINIPEGMEIYTISLLSCGTVLNVNGNLYSVANLVNGYEQIEKEKECRYFAG